MPARLASASQAAWSSLLPVRWSCHPSLELAEPVPGSPINPSQQDEDGSFSAGEGRSASCLACLLIRSPFPAVPVPAGESLQVCSGLRCQREVRSCKSDWSVCDAIAQHRLPQHRPSKWIPRIGTWHVVGRRPTLDWELSEHRHQGCNQVSGSGRSAIPTFRVDPRGARFIWRRPNPCY